MYLTAQSASDFYHPAGPQSILAEPSVELHCAKGQEEACWLVRWNLGKPDGPQHAG